MNKSSVMLMVSCLLAGVSGVAGDLTVEGSLNVTSNLTAGSISATNAAVGSLAVSGGAVINGPIQGNGSGLTNVPGSALVPGSVGTNRAVTSEWNAWGDERYLRTGFANASDLFLDGAGRIVAGWGLSVANISDTAYGASQLGFNVTVQNVGPYAFGAVQRGWNKGSQLIMQDACGAVQSGGNGGEQTIGFGSMGAEQQGRNSGTQSIDYFSCGASQVGENYGVQVILWDAKGAEQRGFNFGTQIIGPEAYGAAQRGYVSVSACATNSGAGSLQLLNLADSQLAIMAGSASVGLGACRVTDDQAVVAGDGQVSHGRGTVTAVGFFGDGSGLTNLDLSAYAGLNPVQGRQALGLGSAATNEASAFAPADLSPYASETVTYSNGHFHAASQLASSDVTNAVLAAWPQLDTNASNDLTVAGGMLTGNLNMNSNRVENLPVPQADGDAASKAYLRSVLSCLPPQGNLSMGAYTNGAPDSFPLSF